MPFDELPTALQSEILRRIAWFAAFGVLGVVVVSLLMGLTMVGAVSGNNSFGITLAARLGAVFLVLLTPIIISLLLIVRGMGGWSGVLSTRRLVELYGINLADLSTKAFRSQMRKSAYWWHGLAGLAVTAGLVALSQAFWQGLTVQRLGLPMAALNAGLVGYWVMLRAWQIRQSIGSLALKGTSMVAKLAPEIV